MKRKVVDAKKNINVSRFGLCPERGSWDFAATLIDVHGPLDLGNRTRKLQRGTPAIKRGLPPLGGSRGIVQFPSGKLGSWISFYLIL